MDLAGHRRGEIVDERLGYPLAEHAVIGERGGPVGQRVFLEFRHAAPGRSQPGSAAELSRRLGRADLASTCPAGLAGPGRAALVRCFAAALAATRCRLVTRHGRFAGTFRFASRVLPRLPNILDQLLFSPRLSLTVAAAR